MFEQQTFENILSRMLEDISDEIDKREGSVAYDMLAPKAAELAQAYIELDNVLNFGFAETTFGQFLDMKVAEAGLTRKPQDRAKGVLVLTNTSDETIVVPTGTLAETNAGITFRTLENVDVGSQPVQVKIEAVEFGVLGNVPVNSIINFGIEDIQCTNPEITSGGVDIESDVKLLERYYIKVRTPATSGNVYHYLNWANSVNGIGGARVIPTWNGNGTVKVIVIGNDKTVVNSEKINEVFEYIEKERPIGADVTVVSIAEKNIDISVKLSLVDGYTNEGVLNEVKNKIKEYLYEVSFVDYDIKYSKIGSIILTVDGVVDYSELTLNGQISNVDLEVDEIPNLGEVTLL